MQATLSELRKDMLIRYQGEWYRILDFEHVRPGQERPLIWITLKHLDTGEYIERVRTVL